MSEGLMANKVGKSYLINDVYETIAVDSYPRGIPSEVLECYKFSKYVVDPNKARFKKRNQKSVNLALRRKQATLVY